MALRLSSSTATTSRAACTQREAVTRSLLRVKVDQASKITVKVAKATAMGIAFVIVVTACESCWVDICLQRH
jgi:hypothetical protein